MRELKLKPHYDLIIIGGGIQGCAMLWEAQSRGLNSLLVEAQDYCSQTSANSLKTIHGGIRYLQTLNLSRTCRSAKEQETLLRIAPHLVHSLPCLLPTQRKLKRSRLAVTTGFTLYNLLKRFACSNPKLPQARCLSKTNLAEHTDLLDSDKVTGAGFWHDAQVQHAERLGLAFVNTAQAAGADAYNYLKANALTTEQDQNFQLDLECQISQQRHNVSSDSIVFCTASKTVENLSDHKFGTDDYPSFCLAVNLIIKNRYAEVAIGLQSGFAQKNNKDGSRLLFAAPWLDSTLFGTWYFDANSNLGSNPHPSNEQIEFCLADINRTYPAAQFSNDDILTVQAGCLPVNHAEQDPENNLMESDLIHKPSSRLNLFVVIPTKYTTCRATAEETVNQLMTNMSKEINKSVSAKLPLVGAKSIQNFQEFKQAQKQNYRQNFSTQVLNQLLVNYGDRTSEIIEICNQNSQLAELIPGSDSHIKAQLEYELEHGQVERLSDFVSRRSFLMTDSASNRIAIEYCEKRINQFHST